MRLLTGLLAASLLSSSALAQVSTLSNPSSAASITNLNQLPTIANNTLLGNSSGGSTTPSALTNATLGGNLTGLGTTPSFGPQTGGAADVLLSLDSTNTAPGMQFRTWSAGSPTVVAGVSYSAGVQSLVLNAVPGAGSIDVRVAGVSSYNLNATNLNLINKAIAQNGTTIINSSGVLQAVAFPALTGDVTTSAGALGTTIANSAVTTAKMANLGATSLLGNPTGGATAPSAITLAGGLGFSGSTLTAAGALTPTSVASSGAISGTTLAGTSSILSSGATAGVGYATGAGGAISQGTSRVTGVTLNKACGAITIFSAAGAATYNTFTVTDSAVAATDTIVINQKSGTNLYIILVTAVTAGTFNVSFATTGGTATDAPVFNFCTIKGVAA